MQRILVLGAGFAALWSAVGADRDVRQTARCDCWCSPDPWRPLRVILADGKNGSAPTWAKARGMPVLPYRPL